VDILTALVVGLVVGFLGRLVVRGHGRIGLLLTLLIGVVGAAVGQRIGDQADFNGLVTFALEVLIAAVLVAIFGSFSGGRGRGRRGKLL
jgi:uncharacterized membrane protein YeaQ/YmgE (transglycosylase-associated protein family)